MKRIISCCIALCIIALGIIPISANNTNTISKSEAQELVGKACDFHHDVHVCTQFDENPIANINGEQVYVYDEETKEVKLKAEGWKFFRVYEENLPGGSFEAMCKYADTLYTEDIVTSSYMFLPDENNIYESYLRKNGGLYFQDINGAWFLDSPLDHAVAFLNTEYYENKDYTKISIDIISGDWKSAIAKIDVHDAWGWSDTVTCKFVNTQEGWRIAESEYSILLAIGRGGMEEYRVAVSPSTGDTAGERVAVIGAVSLACIIPTACLMRRRRRNTF